MGTTHAAAAVAVAFAVLLLLTVGAYVAFTHYRGQIDPEGARQICLARLRELGYALQQYAETNRGMLPKELTDLYPGYINDRAVFRCPFVIGADTATDYGYDGRATDKTTFTVMAAYDLEGNHSGTDMPLNALLM